MSDVVLSHPAGPDFVDLRNRAELLDLCGDPEGAERMRERALLIAREVDLICYGYQLMWRNRVDEAIDLLRRNAEQHPHSWNAHDSLGDAYCQKGLFYEAQECFRAALSLAGDPEICRRLQHRVEELRSFHPVA